MYSTNKKKIITNLFNFFWLCQQSASHSTLFKNISINFIQCNLQQTLLVHLRTMPLKQSDKCLDAHDQNGDQSCFGDNSDHLQQIRPDSETVKTSLTYPSSTLNKTMSRIPTYLVYFFKFRPEIVRFFIQKVDRCAILISKMADRIMATVCQWQITSP